MAGTGSSSGVAQDSQARFGQSVKGLLTEKVSVCSADAIALTKQVLKGSRSSELLGQAARNMVMQEDAILHSEDSLRKMGIITTHLQYQQEAIQKNTAASGCCFQGQDIHKAVKDYYGKHLKKSDDLKTSACITPDCLLTPFIRDALKDIHEEVVSRYYGCGLLVPECLENKWILDLGCGSGRDCYMLSKLVGERGHVTGIDMTNEQIEVAKKYIGYHMQKFGFQHPNVDFIHGYIEKLGDAGLKDSSYDIIISNCVINLVLDKKTVLEEAYRVLKDGGEMYFSDVYASADLPYEIRTHQVLWGECLGGAMWWKDLFKIAKNVGFCTRLVTANYITVNNKELESIIGDYRFVSATLRLFKIPNSSANTKYQVVYNGGIPGHKEELHFDANFTFKKGEGIEVDEETANILKNSRFADEFLIRPVKEDLSTTSGGCCSKKSKDIITDPFILVEKLKAKNTTPVPGGHCATRDCC